MLNRSFALPLLIASAALAYAQDPLSSGDLSAPSSPAPASTSPDSGGTGAGGNSGTKTGTGIGAGNNTGASATATDTGAATGADSTTGAGHGFVVPTPSGVPGRTGTGGTFDQSFDQGFNQGNVMGSGTVPVSAAKTPAANVPEGPSFKLPGGYGAAPKTVTPGEGTFARPPITFTTTVQQGYNDNIYSSSGKNNPDTVIAAHTVSVSQGPFSYNRTIPEETIAGGKNNPVQGSPITQATLGTQILLSASRMVLSAEFNGGASYYWDRKGTPLSPTGSGSLLFAYKLSPRAQFSATITGSYLTQPDLTAVSGVTQGNTGDYITTGSKLDLSYQWTGRISTDTTLNLATQSYMKTSSQTNNYNDYTFGEALRYAFSPRMTLVMEGRYGDTIYPNSTNGSQTQYILAGVDLTVSSRIQASFRGGESYREFDASSLSASTPFMEANLDYGFGRAATLDWTARYGFEDGVSTGGSTQKTLRSTISLREGFSPKFSANISVGYSNSASVNVATTTTTSQNTQDTVTFGLGCNYLLSRTVSLFGSFSRSQVFSTPVLTYSTDTVFLGATYQF